MVARKPATAAEIVRVLESQDRIKKGLALPYDTATRFLRIQLKTTTRRAYEWLDRATSEEPHEFELISTTTGRVTYVNRAGSPVLLNEAGYASGDYDEWPNLSPEGELVRDSTSDEDFVVLSKDLRAMCERAADLVKKAKLVKERNNAAAIEGAEERHGASIGYLRGLLKTAGIEITDDVFSARYKDSIKGGQTILRLEVKDGAIDALASVLAAFGIEPYPPSGAVTLKPQIDVAG
jgi:hypothetical protein